MERPGAARFPRRCRRGGRRSEVLAAIAADTGQERISIGYLADTLRDRAFAALLIVFAAPNILPTSPGTSTVLGLPLVFLTLQLMLGRPKTWLPGFITNRTIAAADFRAVVGRMAPRLARVERLLAPQLKAFIRPPAEYLLGAVALLLAIVLVLPIPFGNMLPAVAICLFALAILERDGLFALFGLATTVAALAIVGGVVYAAVRVAAYLLLHAFG
ncbi:MAG: exopolysaccharide biosynthesis protein [Alphaproteobacteria bacterium]|nr:exopolysaccharide biosynthesis protein [Alphaproteobacteria bacterium]